MIPDTRISAAVVCALLASASLATAQTPDPGRQTFVARCTGCHGTDGNGGELGPAISMRVPARTDEDLTTLFREGLTAAGMPAFANMGAAETQELIRYIRTLRETFHVYVDRLGVLRTDHTVRFLGLTPLRLHYKLERLPAG